MSAKRIRAQLRIEAALHELGQGNLYLSMEELSIALKLLREASKESSNQEGTTP